MPAHPTGTTQGATDGTRPAGPTPAEAGDALSHRSPAQATLPGTEPGAPDSAIDDTSDAATNEISGQPSKAKATDPTHLALLRVDMEALKRGRTTDGELCEIAGVGPIAVSAARALLPESVLELVITRGTDVANVTHLGRGPTTAQKIALLWTSPGCDVETCPRRHPRGIQHDHRTPWADCHETVLDNLDRKCGHHHDLKTHHGWELIPGTGPRPMVPPHHPDHPDNHPGNHRPDDHQPPGDPPP